MRQLLSILLAGALTGPAGLNGGAEDVSQAAVVDAGELAPDAGAPAIWSRCVEPPAGDVAQDLGDAGVLLSPARASFDACRIGAGAKCSSLLEQLPDAGAVDQSKSNLWIITSTICALSGVFTAYANNRTSRHLALWPP